MNGWLWFFVILVGILLLLFFTIIITKLTIEVYLYHGNDNDKYTIKFRAWFGLIQYKIDIPMVKINDDANVEIQEKTQLGKEDTADTTSEKRMKFSPKDFLNMIQDTKSMLEHVQAMHKIIRKFLNTMKLRNIKWDSVIGVSDAATTGTLTGLLWSAKGGLIGVISNYMRLQNMPSITITPSFQKPIIQTEFSCIIQFRIGNAILVGLKIFRYWRGGKFRFKSMPLSLFSSEKQSV